MYQDTIAAIATPIGEGGIGIIRISGPDANAVTGRVFRRAGRGGGDVARFPSHRLVYGHVVDPESGAYLDASADFPEDEIPPADVGAALAEAAERLDALVRRAAVGVLYREGLQVAIVGRPNVGKSSLLNALLRQERAIVTPVAGTTRD